VQNRTSVDDKLLHDQKLGIRTIVIEDEVNTLDFFTAILSDHCPDIQVVATARSVQQSIMHIDELQPDLVFMDIEIHGGTGFDVLKSVTYKNFHVIFITSHLEYSIKAIRMSALDYILKPLVLDDLLQAIERYKLKTTSDHSIKKIKIEGFHRDLSIDLTSIEYITVHKGYCIFHLTDGKVMHSIQSIIAYEKELIHPIRMVHRKYYVNIIAISAIDTGRGGCITMESGEQIPIAYRRKKEIEQMWQDELAN